MSLAATTHIEHFLASLSPLVPTDLEDSYDPPRKTLTDEHAAVNNGVGFASLTAAQDRMLVVERPVARAAGTLDLDQHWVDYASRKLSRADTTKAGRKKLVGAVEMGDTPLIEAPSRVLMAGYADSAALKIGAQLRSEFGGRIDAVESSVSALSTQLQTVDSKMDVMKDELLKAVRKGSKGSKGGGKGKSWRPQQQQQQRWSQQPQQQQQAPQSSWQSTVPAPAAGQS